ncbi:hypothetical protein SAMN05216312_10446 [Cohnella sp. OV330]|uniref:hypothetical protein n=1 Tax=Cohnella sp. OV330 TaxID=1855288 RepID=UPI0008E07C2D|nr:hypothetical protein [Cohnella sp. OV330]SFB14811.1 hypothetical protein SAMN05216312_10446 [Cohnella sp. OV330]
MLLAYSAAVVKKEIKSLKSLKSNIEKQNLLGSYSYSSELNDKEISALNKTVNRSDGVSTAGYWS